jgi:hypothetical protein
VYEKTKTWKAMPSNYPEMILHVLDNWSDSGKRGQFFAMTEKQFETDRAQVWENEIKLEPSLRKKFLDEHKRLFSGPVPIHPRFLRAWENEIEHSAYQIKVAYKKKYKNEIQKGLDEDSKLKRLREQHAVERDNCKNTDNYKKKGGKIVLTKLRRKQRTERNKSKRECKAKLETQLEPLKTSYDAECKKEQEEKAAEINEKYNAKRSAWVAEKLAKKRNDKKQAMKAVLAQDTKRCKEVQYYLKQATSMGSHKRIKPVQQTLLKNRLKLM